MKRNRSSISKARSYAEIGEYWDTHDLSDVWGKTRKVKFDVVAEPEATYYPIEKDLSEKIQSVARKRGVSSDTLVNLWLAQKIKEQRTTRVGRKSSGRKRGHSEFLNFRGKRRKASLDIFWLKDEAGSEVICLRYRDSLPP